MTSRLADSLFSGGEFLTPGWVSIASTPREGGWSMGRELAGVLAEKNFNGKIPR